jgi:hypothetical protein
MVFKKFLKYLSFIFFSFKGRSIFLVVLSSINAFSDLILLIALSKLIEFPGSDLFGLDVKIVFGSGIFLKFLGQLVFNIYIKGTMTKINLFVLKMIFKNFCNLPSSKVYVSNEDEFKGLASFQVNQLNQIVLLPFLRVLSDMFILVVVLYFLINLSFVVFLSLFLLLCLYAFFLLYVNNKIKFNSSKIYEEYKKIIYFSENFFNGKLDFTSFKNNYFYEFELNDVFKTHQVTSNTNVFLSALKKVVLEVLVFSFLLIQLLYGELNLSELATLFFVLIRIIPITNNLNLFFSNVNLNKDIVFKINNCVHGVF